MTNNSLNDLSDFINQQLLQYETLSGNLAKAEALAEVALTSAFTEQEENTLHNYMWALRDLLAYTLILNEKLLNEWLQKVNK